MPDYLNYRRSISCELLAVKDRVRNFVSHWPEDGRYKEVILKRTLQNHLPPTVNVGTGFIIGDSDQDSHLEQVSSQIDIIVYDISIPLLFQIDDFVIVPKEAVLGIIEVKTKLRVEDVNDVIEKAHINGELVGRQGVFNGIFSFEEDEAIGISRHLPPSAMTALETHTGYVNNICLGKNLFVKFWERNTITRNPKRHYSFYYIYGLAFGYFISNLVEDCYMQLNKRALSSTIKKFLYPIEGSKETHRIQDLEIVIDD